MKPHEKVRDQLADKFTRDVNGVSQSILSPRGCYEAGFDEGIAYQQARIEKLRAAFNDLLYEISSPTFEDERLSYVECQITKGAVFAAKKALAEDEKEASK